MPRFNLTAAGTGESPATHRLGVVISVYFASVLLITGELLIVRGKGMSRAPDLREVLPAPEEVIQAGLDGNLILFVGAGVSRLLGLPSWPGLAACVLEDLRKENYLNYSEIEQLQTLDAKKQLSIAKLIADENKFELNIGRHLEGKTEGDSIYKALNDIGCSCVTTNYDELLSPRYFKSKDGSETSVPINRVSEKEKFFAKLLNEPGTVVHLHGCVSKPETMVFTTTEYLEHYDHDNVKQFLDELFKRKTVLFLGYGLEEAEILEHILRRGQVQRREDRRRFAVQGFFLSQEPLYEKLHDYYEHSFGVHLLGYMRDHQDHTCLEGIISSWVSQIEIRKPPLLADVEFMEETLGNE